jgi:hypothetical protein
MESILNTKKRTIEDFNSITWHDIKIHAMAFDNENFKLLFDIDFILNWINPENAKENYKFEICPATLIFEFVWDLRLDIDSNLELNIDSVTKEEYNLRSELEYTWHLNLIQGEINFKAKKFEIYFRKKPVISERQYFTLIEREGISFEYKNVLNDTN